MCVPHPALPLHGGPSGLVLPWLFLTWNYFPRRALERLVCRGAGRHSPEDFAVPGRGGFNGRTPPNRGTAHRGVDARVRENSLLRNVIAPNGFGNPGALVVGAVAHHHQTDCFRLFSMYGNSGNRKMPRICVPTANPPKRWSSRSAGDLLYYGGGGAQPRRAGGADIRDQRNTKA